MRRRKPKGHVSGNAGRRNESFRSYAHYMEATEFRQAVDDMLSVATARRTAYMCSEAVYRRCHRRSAGDYLSAHAVVVQHIMPTGVLKPHVQSPGAVVEAGCVNHLASEDA